MKNICIFCLRHIDNCVMPVCKENPGFGCTYGMRHEYPQPRVK